jgi:predicted nucleotidyltransferase
MIIPTASEVISRSGFHPSRVKNIYVFGSQVYGTTTQKSDWDFIMIANTPNTSEEIKSEDFNIHVVTQEHFLLNLKKHHSSSVEAYLAPSIFRLKEDIQIDWVPNISSLRHSFSHISSNSWVKCKKKIQKGDYYIGIKSLFHSLRIPLFGIQIAQTGIIQDFSVANHIHDKLFSKQWSWNELDTEFRELRNSILTDFRNITTK